MKKITICGFGNVGKSLVHQIEKSLNMLHWMKKVILMI